LEQKLPLRAERLLARQGLDVRPLVLRGPDAGPKMAVRRELGVEVERAVRLLREARAQASLRRIRVLRQAKSANGSLPLVSAAN
jgi:hypothetical protein